MKDIEKHIGIILRVGVAISILIILLGLVVLVFGTGADMPTTSDITLNYIFRGLLSLNPWSFMLFGILMLIATPLLRVVASIISFAIEKDILYTVITTIVLLILLISIIVAFIV